jgi:arsenate reductase
MTGRPEPGRPIRVFFVCTGNSARSLIAEGLLRHKGGADFDVESAGTHPRGVNPFTLRVMAEAGVEMSHARSKSVTEFLDQEFDYVITVCDQAREACPVFPGSHETLHWGYTDPAEVEGTDEEKLRAFRRTMIAMSERIDQFVIIARRTRAGTVGTGASG